MSQIKIYAHKALIEQKRQRIGDAIHRALVDALAYPAQKRFQRFIGLDAQDFIYPDDRSDDYIIIEVSMFVGRSVAAKKRFIQLIFEYLSKECQISPQDVEITIFETPKEIWGIRGKSADELSLNYQVEV